MHGRRWLVLGCFVVSALGASAARAGGGGTFEGGTITFVGALVAPTCNLSVVPDVVSTMAQQSRQRNCSGTSSASANASGTYTSSVVHLSSSESDQVLRYFASYVRAAQPNNADPVLVTQTYE
ncbi:hypothetical protein DWU98_17680 [Dyella monticola]|uniref:Type 1 fimbrial protein n=1 Tax=Dyella monticola TaxID=1927958 RepID=A0A370WTE8_9GAMM|nr:hypothetical protein [Dyella monticola]RDS79394.1 hypothetical protein DWU98_17680 [Dyella monticola]